MDVVYSPSRNEVRMSKASYERLVNRRDFSAGPLEPLTSAQLFEKAQAKELEEACAAAKAQQLAEAEVERLAAVEAAKVAKDALKARIMREVSLAHATALFLEMTSRVLVCKEPNVEPKEELAWFIDELQPLAASYGVEIVAVGNKTTATVNLK